MLASTGKMSDEEFERRTTGAIALEPAAAFDLPVTGTEGIAQSGPLEAIAIYERLLKEYPNYERRDQVLYQMARAYDELGRTEEASILARAFVARSPRSVLIPRLETSCVGKSLAR